MIDLEDEWIGANPNYPDNGNLCPMLDGCVIMGNETAEHVYHMLMKNFERVYSGEEDDFGDFQSCKFSVDEPADGISGERYMTICGYKANGERQSCPPEDRYPWLGDHCGGNTPCYDCDN